MEGFADLRFGENGRPLMFDQELELFSGSQVKFYQLDQPTGDRDGRVTITSHRLFYRNEHKNIFLNLSNVQQISKESGFMKRSSKIRIHTVKPPGHYYKLSFKEGGCDAFLSSFESALQRKSWTIDNKKPSAIADKRLEQPTGFSASNAGISGILKRKEQEQKRHSELATEAFSDISSLMERAKDMVGLIEKYVSAQETAKNESIQEGEHGKQDDELELNKLLLNMGISNPVTRENSGSAYHMELARELFGFIKKPLEKHNGIMSLADVYCLFNRARGTELISPDDLFQASSLQKKLKLGIHLRKFATGLLVLQLDSHKEDQVADRLLKLVQTSPHQYITSTDVSSELKISVPLAREYLKMAEEHGKLCRDDTFEGLNFFENKFPEYFNSIST